MSISRHLVALFCTPALGLSCASRPELARSQPPQGTQPAWLSEARALTPRVVSPYAPIRTANQAVYSWHSEKRVDCSPRAEEPLGDHPLEQRGARAVLAALPERASEESTDPPAWSGPSAERVVAGLRPVLHHCFSRWLADEADAQGSVRFALELGCDGDVAAISANVKGVDESTLTCLFSAVAQARFAPPTAGHATVNVPVVFRHAAR
ncbi:MAG: hypothetical protein ABW061_21105 [Polyangiaceae bacterium]